MSAFDYTTLATHVGHRIACVTYGHGANVAVECATCSTILLDYDREKGDPSDYSRDAQPLAEERALRVALEQLTISAEDIVGLGWGDQHGYFDNLAHDAQAARALLDPRTTNEEEVE